MRLTSPPSLTVCDVSTNSTSPAASPLSSASGNFCTGTRLTRSLRSGRASTWADGYGSKQVISAGAPSDALAASASAATSVEWPLPNST